MMCTVEMYMIFVGTLMITVQGSPQSCRHYCNFLPEYSSIPPECDCSQHNLQKTRPAIHIKPSPVIKDSGIYYEPVNLYSPQNTSFDEQTLNTLKVKVNTLNVTKHNLLSANTDDESIAVQDSYDEIDSKSINKNEKRDSSKTQDHTKELLLHLYLDLYLNISENSHGSQVEEFKNMFKTFQEAEKDLSECINLHIYIFSKYIDTIDKTNKNSGHKGEQDNLSSAQELTEIQSKCGQPASIIKQSIYQIKQAYPRVEEHPGTLQDELETILSVDTKKDEVAQDVTNESRTFGNTTSQSKYRTLTTPTTNDVDSNSENTEVVVDETVNLHLFNNSHSAMNVYTSTAPSYDPTIFTEVSVDASTTLLSDYENLRTTIRDRPVVSEGDMTIPRIITKELSNGTITSVVDGYEKLPNSDFANYIISTSSNKSANSNTNDSKSTINDIIQSDLVEVHGNLYFSFGNNQIPARFIQQPDGELNVAIDGFSMCDHMLRENTSNFINLLCKCIKHKNCT